MSDWHQKSLYYQLGTWLITVGQSMLRKAEKVEMRRRVVARLIRLRHLPKDANYMRQVQDIAAEEMTQFYVEELRHKELRRQEQRHKESPA